MRPDRVVLSAEALGHGLSLSSCCEQHGIEELIPDPSVERLGKDVLPWRSRHNVSTVDGVAVLASVP